MRESLELNAQLLDALESKLVGLEQVTEAQRARVAQLAAGLLAVRSAETRAPEQDGSSAILAE